MEYTVDDTSKIDVQLTTLTRGNSELFVDGNFGKSWLSGADILRDGDNENSWGLEVFSC
jgi:hypothetical protein